MPQRRVPESSGSNVRRRARRAGSDPGLTQGVFYAVPVQTPTYPSHSLYADQSFAPYPFGNAWSYAEEEFNPSGSITGTGWVDFFAFMAYGEINNLTLNGSDVRDGDKVSLRGGFGSFGGLGIVDVATTLTQASISATTTGVAMWPVAAQTIINSDGSVVYPDYLAGRSVYTQFP